MTTFLNLYGIEVILNEKKVPAKASARKKKIILIFFFNYNVGTYVLVKL